MALSCVTFLSFSTLSPVNLGRAGGRRRQVAVVGERQVRGVRVRRARRRRRRRRLRVPVSEPEGAAAARAVGVANRAAAPALTTDVEGNT